MDPVKCKTDGALDVNTFSLDTSFFKFTQIEREKVGLAVFIKSSILIYMTSNDLRLDLVCLFWVDVKVADDWVFVDRVGRRIMLVEILCVVQNDELHLFQFIINIRVTCDRTSIFTLWYFKDKLSEGVMSIVVITSERDILTAFLSVDLRVCYTTSN